METTRTAKTVLSDETPPPDKMFSLRLPDSLYEALGQESTRTDRSMAYVARAALEAYLSRPLGQRCGACADREHQCIDCRYDSRIAPSA